MLRRQTVAQLVDSFSRFGVTKSAQQDRVATSRSGRRLSTAPVSLKARGHVPCPNEVEHGMVTSGETLRCSHRGCASLSTDDTYSHLARLVFSGFIPMQSIGLLGRPVRGEQVSYHQWHKAWARRAPCASSDEARWRSVLNAWVEDDYNRSVLSDMHLFQLSEEFASSVC